MALTSFSQLLLVALLAVTLTFVAGATRRRGKGGNKPSSRNNKGFGGLGCAADSAVNKNISALWTHVQLLSQPIEVHVHGGEARQCDDYFGCNFDKLYIVSHGPVFAVDLEKSKNNNSHSSHDHGTHKHGTHKHGTHKHAGHTHGGHKHGDHKHGKGKKGGKPHSHGAHHGHGHGSDMGFQDNHIHIHLSLDKNDGCDMVSYAPKDEFVYARCDMMAEKNSGIKGSIYMRQMPHGVLESKIQLNGFKGASKGVQDGKHDYFFDVHKLADFSDGCASFGAHDHVHHSDGKFDHQHAHTHDDDKDHAGKHTHNHEKHDGHDHSVHDHHAHGDDWGNVIVNRRGVANMEVNCTHHELYGPESMFGRGIVLHDKDDKAVSCCAITYANLDDTAWEKL